MWDQFPKATLLNFHFCIDMHLGKFFFRAYADWIVFPESPCLLSFDVVTKGPRYQYFLWFLHTMVPDASIFFDLGSQNTPKMQVSLAIGWRGAIPDASISCFPIFVVFGVFIWSQKLVSFSKNRWCGRQCAFFSSECKSCLPIVRKCHLNKKLFCSQPPRNIIFCFFLRFSFSMFVFLFSFSIFSFLFCFLQHEKNKSDFFSKTLCWHRQNLQQNIFAPLHTICDFKKYQKDIIQLGKNKQNNGANIWPGLGQILTQDPPNGGQVLTLKNKKLCIYIYAVKSIIGPGLAIFTVNNWAKSKSIIGPRSFSHYKNRGFRRFFLLSYHCVCFFVPNY